MQRTCTARMQACSPHPPTYQPANPPSSPLIPKRGGQCRYDTGFVKKLETIADEAEAVALELAGGKEMTSKDQQDMMWNQQMVLSFPLLPQVSNLIPIFSTNVPSPIPI